jgi:cytochrome c-type biogenesis protein CcmH/NrfG
VLSVHDIRADGAVARGRTHHFDVLDELGNCYAVLGEFERAEECYTAAALLEPNRAAPFIGLGVIALQLERLGEAEVAFETAARREPDSAEAYGGLAMVRQQRGDYASAFDMHLKCLQLDADNLVALLGLFQASCQMGTFAKVIHYLEIYLQRHPGDAAVLFCLATLYAREGQLDDARQCLLSVLALEPEKPEAVQLLQEVQRQHDRTRPRNTVNAP